MENHNQRWTAVGRLQRELMNMANNPIPGITIKDHDTLDENPSSSDPQGMITWEMEIVGAEETLYAGERMNLRFKFCSKYPFAPPEVIFVPPNIPIHPYVYSNGHICLSTIADDWSSAFSVNAICLSIISMLSSCKEKKPPENNEAYVDDVANYSPKDVQWEYHDDKC